MNRRQAKLLYNKVHPVLVSLAKNSGEEALKRHLQKEASSFWTGFTKRAGLVINKSGDYEMLDDSAKTSKSKPATPCPANTPFPEYGGGGNA